MTIQEFAKKYHLRVTKTGEFEEILNDKTLSSIYEYGEETLNERFGVMFRSQSDNAKPWNVFKRQCLESGMIIIVDGDTEGAMEFDPENKKQAKLAIQGIAVKRIRKGSL